MGIKVTRNVLNGLEAVRDSGRTNMFILKNVVNIANELGYHETASWIENNPKKYSKGVFNGFDSVDSDSSREN